MRNDFIPMVDVVPAAVLGVAKIEHIVITQQDADRHNINTRSPVRPGSIAMLRVNDEVMMSDTDMEKRTNYGVLYRAKGDVLITGLGIGMILVPILKKEEVRSVTVIEKYQDVVDLVLPAILAAVPEAKDKLTVIVRDVLEYKPKKGELLDSYSTIYHDIWPYITDDNLPEMTLLKRRYARRVAKDGWQGCWEEDRCRYEKRRADAMAKVWSR